MDTKLLQHIWDHTRQRYGVYLRTLEAIPEDKLQSNPVPGMRTPAELAVHISSSIVRDIARGVARGKVEATESDEGAVASDLTSQQDILEFAKQCWKEADTAVHSITQEQLDAEVPTPWGGPMQGRVLIHVLNDEFMHHRGQLSVFVRASGEAPPMIWGFAENAPEFRPQI